MTFEIKTAQPANPYEPDDTNVSEQPLYNGILYIDESGKYCIANSTDDIEKRNAEEILNDMGKEKW